MSQKKIIITAPIADSSACTSLSGLSSGALSADFYARYQRMIGHDVRMIGGIDGREDLHYFYTHLGIHFDAFGSIAQGIHPIMRNSIFARMWNDANHAVKTVLTPLENGYGCLQRVYFDVGIIQDKIEHYMARVMTPNAREQVRVKIQQGLGSWPLTRGLGVFEPWFNRVVGYISIEHQLAVERKEIAWFLRPDEVRMAQFVGRDEVISHALIGPAALITAGHSWVLPGAIYATENLVCEGPEMSVEEIMHENADFLRLYLAYIRAEKEEGIFRLVEMYKFYYDMVVGRIINYIMRIMKLAINQGLMQKTLDVAQLSDSAYGKALAQAWGKYHLLMEEVHFAAAVRVVFEVGDLGHDIMNKYEPWKTRQIDIIAWCLAVVQLMGYLMSPFAPQTSEKIRTILGPFVSSSGSTFKMPQTVLLTGLFRPF